MWLTNAAKELLGAQHGRRRTKRVRLSRRFRQRIYWRDGGRCVYCNRKVAFSDATMDHFNPLVRQGRARLKENIVTACRNCNQKKGPLVQEVVDEDLTPEALWMKFDKVTRELKERKGGYAEYIAQVAPIK